MEVLRSEHWGSISYCCGWGRRASRGPNPLLQAQLGGLRMVPVPWLTSSKPAQMSWSPSHTHRSPTHTQIPPSPRTLSWPHNQNKALRWHFLSQEHSPCSLNWYLWYLISSAVHLSCPLCLPSGPERAPSRRLTPSMVRFLSDLSMEISLSLSILCCPLVAAGFQIGNQGQEAAAATLSVRFWMTHLNQNRK